MLNREAPAFRFPPGERRFAWPGDMVVHPIADDQWIVAGDAPGEAHFWHGACSFGNIEMDAYGLSLVAWADQVLVEGREAITVREDATGFSGVGLDPYEAAFVLIEHEDAWVLATELWTTEGTWSTDGSRPALIENDSVTCHPTGVRLPHGI